jgi:hypothetical protein
MEETNRNILTNDLCGRLPYDVKVQYKGEVFDIDYISARYNELKLDNYLYNYTIDVLEVKPYLFPLDSMTDEQKEEWKSLVIREAFGKSDGTFTLQDFYNKNYIDYRGLIPMGLAINAIGLNIY